MVRAGDIKLIDDVEKEDIVEETKRMLIVKSLKVLS